MKGFILVAVSLVLGGCVSASTQNKMCAGLGLVTKVVEVVDKNAGEVISEYMPNRCVNVGVGVDIANFTGDVNVGITER